MVHTPSLRRIELTSEHFQQIGQLPKEWAVVEGWVNECSFSLFSQHFDDRHSVTKARPRRSVVHARRRVTLGRKRIGCDISVRCAARKSVLGTTLVELGTTRKHLWANYWHGTQTRWWRTFRGRHNLVAFMETLTAHISDNSIVTNNIFWSFRRDG